MQKLLEQLFRNYHKEVYRYLYSLSRDEEISEELTSEVFLQVIKSIAGFRGESDIRTWIFSIARHKWLTYLRQKKRRVQTEALSEFIESRDKKPENSCYDQQLLERIYALLDEEPSRTKEIVLMRMEGYSFYEIGNQYHISENSARVIDFRAKAKIRKILTKEGYERE